MPDNQTKSPAFAAVQTALDNASALVRIGERQAANVDDPSVAQSLMDQFLQYGTIVMTYALDEYREPALSLRRAAWTINRPVWKRPEANESDRAAVVMRDVNIIMQCMADPFAYPLTGQVEVDAFGTVARYLGAHDHYNEAMQLLMIAEDQQLNDNPDSPLLEKIRQQQTSLFTAQIDRADDMSANRVIEPERLPLPLLQKPRRRRLYGVAKPASPTRG